ncbi:MAG: FHA domain-containing protein [Pseudomonadota bacterium]|nr:FHA domain-containing protein [Pseudomonadota bacterium]
MASQPLPASSQILFEIVSGSQRGSIFQILAGRATIGRSEENDIALNDPKCSRIHALIEVHDNLVLIKDASNKNPFYINDVRTSQGRLKNGDILRVGDTQLKFRNITNAIVNNGSQMPMKAQPLTTAPAAPSAPMQQHGRQQNSASPLKRRTQSSNLNFYVILGVVGFLFYFLLTSTTKKSDDPWKIRTSSDIAADIQKSKESQEMREALMAQKGKNSRQYLDAQASFIRGFRDYQNGQYGLARRSFEQTLSVYPQHELAERYRLASDQKIKEFIQNYMREGKKYLDRHNYALCSSAYKKVMDTIGDSQNKTHQEAEQRWKECNVLQMGRY